MFAASKSGSVDAKDPQFNYVTMLLHGNGTNGAQNNTFVDSSTNNFTITRNGNTTQGTFSPYGSNWSNYFDGSGDYLTATSPNLNGTWTVELWWFPLTLGTQQTIISFNNGSNSGINIWSNTSGQLVIDDGATGQSAFTSTTFTANRWNHVALVRNGTTTTGYINGVQAGSNTFTPQTTSQARIAGYNNGATPYYASGYISNVRVVNGTAVYTSAFTPSTTPLTAITNTVLLTCQSNRFIDNSINTYTITKNGDTSVQRFSPFSPTTAYSTSVIGGSGYFDGSGDYLLTPSSSNLGLGTGNFTIEFWYYANSSQGTRTILVGNNLGFTTNAWNIQLNNTSPSITNKLQLWAYNLNSGAVFIQGSTTLVPNTWNHVALVRSGTGFTFYLNGVSDGTATSSASLDGGGANTISIARDGTDYFGGYITDSRIVKGTAVYTSAFTPPTAPLTAITNTSLLLSYTNAGILDNAMMNDLETVGNAQISTSVKKYGTGSIYLDGTGDYLNCANPTSVVYQFGTGDFTVEFWAYLTNSGNDNGPIFDTRSTSGNGLLIRQGNGAGGIANRIDAVITGSATASSGTISFNTWIHVAVVRSSGTLKVYYNGTGGTGVTATGNITGTNAYIGAFFDGLSVNIAGYFDDFRVTKGVARYTANFSVPTAAFPDKG